jgi:hypothetical protein
MPGELHASFAQAAEMQGMSFDEAIKEALEQYVNVFENVMNSPVGRETEAILLASLGLTAATEDESKSNIINMSGLANVAGKPVSEK